MHDLIMPKLEPIAIKTRGERMLVRLWRWITTVRQWRLVEDWEYDLPDGPRVVVPKGFRFDGASIPRPLWGLLSPTGLLLIPGLIHDFAYRYDYLWAVDSNGRVYKHNEKAGQDHWDDVFLAVGMKVNGMPIINALAWLALVTLGWWAWRTNRKRHEPEVFPANREQTGLA